MKKSFWAILLCLSLLLSCAMPVFAEEAVSGSDIIEITDEDIKTVYEAYAAETEALDGTEKSKVIDAFNGFMEVADIFNDFEDEHYSKMAELMVCEVDDVFSLIFSVHVDAGIIAEVAEKVDNFIDAPNAKSANELVTYYVKIFDDPDYANYQELILRFFPDIEEIYSAAKAALPAEYIMQVFDAYNELSAALDSWTYEEVVAAQEKFDEMLDVINEMSEDELSKLSELMDCSSEEAFSNLLDVNISGNVICEMGKRYNACTENPTAENAASFVEYYDALYNDSNYVDEALRELVRCFFFDIDDVYMNMQENVSANYVRLSGETRIGTAVAISEHTFNESSVVILASGDNYADALSGASLAYTYGAPILLISNHTLHDTVLAEIERLQANEIIILGGEIAIGANVENKLTQKGYTVNRIWGENRFETAVKIGCALKEYTCEDIEEVFFVRADNYPDALSISSVAAIKGSPILFIDSNGELNSSVSDFIKENEVKNAVVIGGTTAIAESAETNIKAAGIENVSRISGNNRYATCLEVNKNYDELFDGNQLIVATGENYPDALVSSIICAATGSPLLLVDNQKLSPDQSEYIGSRTIRNVLVIGGQTVVSDEMTQEIADLT